MSGEDLLAAIRGVEDRLGAELFPPVVPRLRNTPGEFIEFIDLRGDRAPEDLLPPPGRLANSLTILVDAVQLQEAGFLEGIGACLLRWTPHTLFQLVVASDAPLPAAALERAAEALHNPAHYFNQVNRLNDDPQGRFSIRLFRLVSRAGAAGAPADTDAIGEAKAPTTAVTTSSTRQHLRIELDIGPPLSWGRGTAGVYEETTRVGESAPSSRSVLVASTPAAERAAAANAGPQRRPRGRATSPADAGRRA